MARPGPAIVTSPCRDVRVDPGHAGYSSGRDFRPMVLYQSARTLTHPVMTGSVSSHDDSSGIGRDFRSMVLLSPAAERVERDQRIGVFHAGQRLHPFGHEQTGVLVRVQVELAQQVILA